MSSNVKLHIALATGGLEFTGGDIASQSIGGSETALYYAAKELAKRGHTVHVFNNCPRPDTYDGVQYHHLEDDWNKFASLYEFDVVISSRVLPLLASNFRSKMNILWCHDMPGDPGTLMTHLWKTDRIILLSEYQKQEYTKELKMLDPIIFKSTNGIDLDLIKKSIVDKDGKPFPRHPTSLIYSSRPERGLYYLLKEIWPKIFKINPNIKLYVSSYSLGGHIPPEEIRNVYGEIKKLMQHLSPKYNVHNLGDLDKTGYYEALARCTAWIYPTNFTEISCINALEAMACGTVVISTNKYALKETIGDKGILIDGDNDTEQYQKKFIDQLMSLLNDNHKREALVAKGYKWVEENYQWSTVIDGWEKEIYSFFENRVASQPIKVAKELLRHDDYCSAQKLVEKFNITDADVLEDVRSGFVHAEEADRGENYDLANPVLSGEWRYDVPPRADQCIAYYKHYGVGKRFLDLGAHWGEIACMFSHQFPGTEFTLLDINKKNLDIADTYLHGKAGNKTCTFKFEEGTIDRLVEKVEKGELKKWDSVFAGEIVEHIVDTQAFMRKMMKLVKDDGCVVLTVPSGCWRPMTGFRSYERGGHVHHFEMADCLSIWGDQKDFSLLNRPAGTCYDGSLNGNWIIAFRKSDKKFGPHNFERKLLVTPPYQSVSLCMITKNEEDNISRALKSIIPVVDEAIIYDTGSTDATIKIASKFDNTTVIKGKWEDDFSIARNHSVKPAKGSWILWVDADEILINADHIRKYLGSLVYHGFVIRQNHLMLDMKAPADTPVRLYRNDPGYEFYGVIHEHCQKSLDEPIEPAMVLPDVDIAHMGYLTESVRRYRCKVRNLPLLIKDRQKNPTRKLGFILMQRDYINMMEWEFEKSRGKPTPKAVQYLRTSCKIFWDAIKNEEHLYYKLGWPLYQRALEKLGQHGIPAHPDFKEPPFECNLALAAALGGLSDRGKAARPAALWFATRDEFKDYLDKKRDEMFGMMGYDKL